MFTVMWMTPAEFMQRYECATKSHDLDALLGMIADDAVYLFSNKSAHVGKAEIASALKRNFEVIQAEDYQHKNLSWLAILPEVAVCVYDFHWAGVIDGKPCSGGGRGTSVMASVHGAWRMVHEHLSA